MSAVIRATAWASVCTLAEIIVNLRAPVVTPPVRCSVFRPARRTEPINCPRITGPPLVYQSVKTFARRTFRCNANGRRARCVCVRERIVRHRENCRDRLAFPRCNRLLIKDSELIRSRSTCEREFANVRYLFIYTISPHCVRPHERVCMYTRTFNHLAVVIVRSAISTQL